MYDFPVKRNKYYKYTCCNIYEFGKQLVLYTCCNIYKLENSWCLGINNKVLLLIDFIPTSMKYVCVVFCINIFISHLLGKSCQKSGFYITISIFADNINKLFICAMKARRGIKQGRITLVSQYCEIQVQESLLDGKAKVSYSAASCVRLVFQMHLVFTLQCFFSSIFNFFNILGVFFYRYPTVSWYLRSQSKSHPVEYS